MKLAQWPETRRFCPMKCISFEQQIWQRSEFQWLCWSSWVEVSAPPKMKLKGHLGMFVSAFLLKPKALLKSKSKNWWRVKSSWDITHPSSPTSPSIPIFLHHVIKKGKMCWSEQPLPCECTVCVPLPSSSSKSIPDPRDSPWSLLRLSSLWHKQELHWSNPFPRRILEFPKPGEAHSWALTSLCPLTLHQVCNRHSAVPGILFLGISFNTNNMH